MLLFHMVSRLPGVFLNLALKKPARCNLLSREMYSVAPIPRFETDPSVIIHIWSLGQGKVIVLRSDRDF